MKGRTGTGLEAVKAVQHSKVLQDVHKKGQVKGQHYPVMRKTAAAKVR